MYKQTQPLRCYHRAALGRLKNTQNEFACFIWPISEVRSFIRSTEDTISSSTHYGVRVLYALQST